MTKIILVRHGESIGNLKHVFLGHTDWDLTEKGYEQARCAAEYSKKFHIDAIYASDLKRAYNTAGAIAKEHGMDVIPNMAFREINAGLWEGKRYDEIDAQYSEMRYIWNNDIGNARCDGGESVKELQKRVVAEFERIGKLHRGETVLIGTHATPIRVIKCYLMGKDIEYAKNIPWSPNASTTIVDVEKKEIILDGYADYLGEFMVAPSGKM